MSAKGVEVKSKKDSKTVTPSQGYLPHSKRFEMKGGKFAHPIEQVLLSEIVNLKSEIRHLRTEKITQVNQATVGISNSTVNQILNTIEDVQRKRMLNERNIRSEESLLQYSVDFFINPSNLDGIPNDSRATEIADKMLFGNNPAVHRTQPKLIGEVAKVTEVQVI